MASGAALCRLAGLWSPRLPSALFLRSSGCLAKHAALVWPPWPGRWQLASESVNEAAGAARFPLPTALAPVALVSRGLGGAEVRGNVHDVGPPLDVLGRCRDRGVAVEEGVQGVLHGRGTCWGPGG